MKKLNFTFLVLSTVFIITSCKHNSKVNKDATVNVKKQSKIVIDKRKLPTVNIKENDKITSPILIKVNSQAIWKASEGTIGYIELIDENENKLAHGILSTKEDWMTNKAIIFSTKLIFDSKKSKRGTLIIHNDPGSGDGEQAGKNINFKIPVTF